MCAGPAMTAAAYLLPRSSRDKGARSSENINPAHCSNQFSLFCAFYQTNGTGETVLATTAQGLSRRRLHTESFTMASCVTHEFVNRQSHGPRELAFVGLLEGQRDVVAVAEAVFSQCRDLRARPVPTDNVRAGCELPCFLLRSADLTLNLRNRGNRHELKGVSGGLQDSC
jgi:hypothetical protein